MADESVHVPQIQGFLQGRFEAHPLLTTIPGYHLAVAALLKVASIESVAAMRAVGAGIGVACALVFWLIRRRLGDPHASRSAALLFFLPFLFPYYFLVYTDVLSLLDRKSVVSGKSVSVRVDSGGRRLIKKKTNNKTRKQK